MANIHDGTWSVKSVSGQVRKIDLSETYFVFFPPMSKEQKENEILKAQEQLSQGDYRRLNYAKRMLQSKKPSTFWESLEKLYKEGKNAYALFNISAIKGKDLKRFCEEYGFIPFFDVNKENLSKVQNDYVRKYGVGGEFFGDKRMMMDDRPYEKCLMLVHQSSLAYMLENSAINNRGV